MLVLFNCISAWVVLGDGLRFKFFPGSELGPPELLGGIVDLDRPQRLIAHLRLNGEGEVQLQSLGSLTDRQTSELEQFVQKIPFHQFKRTAARDLMLHYTRHRAMC